MKLKILMVDDNQDITNAFSQYFKLSGHDVTVSNNAQNALQIIENEKNDIVLLDMAMPDISGRDIVNYLHKNNKIHSYTIVVLTASSISDDDRNELKRIGVHSVLKKPIDPDELLHYLTTIKT